MRAIDIKGVARSPEEYDYYKESECRRLYLVRAIDWISDEGMGNIYLSQCSRLISKIMQFNREDQGKEIEDRKVKHEILDEIQYSKMHDAGYQMFYLDAILKLDDTYAISIKKDKISLINTKE